MRKRNNKRASMGHLFVVLAFNAWESINALTPAQVAVHPMGKSLGFMLVYDSIADLRKDYPSSEYFEVKPADEKVRYQR